MSYFRDNYFIKGFLDRFVDDMNDKLEKCYLLEELKNENVKKLQGKYIIQLDYFIPGYGKQFSILEGEEDLADSDSSNGYSRRSSYSNSGSNLNSNSNSNSNNEVRRLSRRSSMNDDNKYGLEPSFSIPTETLSLTDLLPQRQDSGDSEYYSADDGESFYGGGNNLLDKINKLPAYERFINEFIRLQLKSMTLKELDEKINSLKKNIESHDEELSTKLNTCMENIKKARDIKRKEIAENIYHKTIGKVVSFFNPGKMESQLIFAELFDYHLDDMNFYNETPQIMFVMKLVPKENTDNNLGFGDKKMLEELVEIPETNIDSHTPDKQFIISQIICYTSVSNLYRKNTHYSVHCYTNKHFQGIKLNSMLYFIYVKSAGIFAQLNSSQLKITHLSTHAVNVFIRKIAEKVNVKVDRSQNLGYDYIVDYRALFNDLDNVQEIFYISNLFERRFQKVKELEYQKYKNIIDMVGLNKQSESKFNKIEQQTQEGFHTSLFDKHLQDYIIKIIKDNNIKPIYLVENAMGYLGYHKEFFIFQLADKEGGTVKELQSVTPTFDKEKQCYILEDNKEIKSTKDIIPTVNGQPDNEIRKKYIFVLKEPIVETLPTFYNIVSKELTFPVLYDTIRKADNELSKILDPSGNNDNECSIPVPLSI